MAKKPDPVIPGSVWVGVECGYHQEHPVIATCNSTNKKDLEFVIKKWLKRPLLQLPNVEKHRRKKYYAQVDSSLLKEDNSVIAKEVVEKNERK